MSVSSSVPQSCFSVMFSIAILLRATINNQKGVFILGWGRDGKEIFLEGHWPQMLSLPCKPLHYGANAVTTGVQMACRAT